LTCVVKMRGHPLFGFDMVVQILNNKGFDVVVEILNNLCLTVPT